MIYRRRSLQITYLCLGLTMLGTGPRVAVENWTSSRQIRDLCPWNGALWAATGGGVLRIDPRTHTAAKWTTADGLPETDVLQLRPWGERLVAATRHGIASFDGARWRRLPPLPAVDAARPPVVAVVNGHLFVASGGRLYRDQDGEPGWTQLALPETVRFVDEAGGDCWAVGARGLWVSPDGRGWRRVAEVPPDPPVAVLQVAGRCVLGTRRGVYLREGPRWHALRIDAFPGATHLAGLSARGDTLLLAIHGSGLWEWDGHGKAHRHPSGRTAAIRGATWAGDELWVGTTEGVRHWSGTGWQNVIAAEEPPGNACLSLSRHAGAVWLATQEGGIGCFTAAGWERVAGPRPHALQLASTAERLWVRYPDGSLGYREEGRWRDLRPGPKERLAWVSGIGTVGEALWAGVWGGVVVGNGAPDGFRKEEWLHGSPLAGQTVTAVASHRGETWVGTAWRGVAVRAADGTWRSYDEGRGLPDSWVTALTSDGERLWVGTFNGGLAVSDGAGWRYPAPVPGPAGRRITALATDARGDVWVGTRGGLARFHAGQWQLWTQVQGLAGDEVQCLLADDQGVWAGTRTGLSRLRWEAMEGCS